ncbi:hypothetical protein [Mesorhizobium sp. J18]|uniref:hypothetical protein n=1 Tax=Mesorhizobium sp. J18 TaxID=935263 RepID=UPI00119CFF2F|nr:hypothetical protein [Mesorhizobium sp. J18]
MSRLESGFRALLPRLQADISPRCFSKAERYTIAAWITKTGVVAHRSANYRSILPASLPRALSQGSSIPAGIKVIAGKVEAGKTIQWAQSNLGFGLVRKSHLPFYDAKQTFVFVLSIADVFLGFGWHGLSNRMFEIFHSGDSTHQIYPHPKLARHIRKFDHLAIAPTEIGLRSKDI